MDLPCSALGAVQLAPILPPCPSLCVLSPGTRCFVSVCVHMCAHPSPITFAAQAYLSPVDAGFVFCLPCSLSVLKSSGLLWAYGTPGAGSTGRRVSEEPGSSVAGFPSASHQLQHRFRSGVELETAATLLWQLEVPSAELSVCPASSLSPKPLLGLGLSCSGARGPALTLEMHPVLRNSFAVLTSSPHRRFSAAVSGGSLAWP